jgi:hypothetical protein
MEVTVRDPLYGINMPTAQGADGQQTAIYRLILGLTRRIRPDHDHRASAAITIATAFLGADVTVLPQIAQQSLGRGSVLETDSFSIQRQLKRSRRHRRGHSLNRKTTTVRS